MDNSVNFSTSKHYKLINIRTIYQNNEKNAGLSFFEALHDIPFEISCIQVFYETSQFNIQNDYEDEKSWLLFFCPCGSVDIMLDLSGEYKIISLDSPENGLILKSNTQRKIIWKQSGSVLCVASS